MEFSQRGCSEAGQAGIGRNGNPTNVLGLCEEQRLEVGDNAWPRRSAVLNLENRSARFCIGFLAGLIDHACPERGWCSELH